MFAKLIDLWYEFQRIERCFMEFISRRDYIAGLQYDSEFCQRMRVRFNLVAKRFTLFQKKNSS